MQQALASTVDKARVIAYLDTLADMMEHDTVESRRAPEGLSRRLQHTYAAGRLEIAIARGLEHLLDPGEAEMWLRMRRLRLEVPPRVPRRREGLA